MILESLKYFVLLSSICIPLFWAVVTGFYKGKNDKAGLYLLLLFVGTAFVFFMTYNRHYENFEIYSTLFFVQVFAAFSLFPLFYLYFASITRAKKSFNIKRLYHFIPSVVYFFFLLILQYGFMNSEERLLFISDHIFDQNMEGLHFDIGYMVYRSGKLIYVLQTIFYLTLVIKEYRIHVKNMNERFSNSEGVDLSWMKTVGLSFLIVFIFNALIHLLKIKYVSSADIIVILSYSVFCIFNMILGMLTINQKVVYSTIAVEYEDIDANESEKLLTIEKMNNYFLIEKPYLNPEFNIYNLCFKFNTNRTYISNFINQNFNQNFRTLINSYRINMAKELINEYRNKDISMEGISIKVGFSSYSSFLRVFKSFEGISPTEYVGVNKRQDKKL